MEQSEEQILTIAWSDISGCLEFKSDFMRKLVLNFKASKLTSIPIFFVIFSGSMINTKKSSFDLKLVVF